LGRRKERREEQNTTTAPAESTVGYVGKHREWYLGKVGFFLKGYRTVHRCRVVRDVAGQADWQAWPSSQKSGVRIM
jgi:hypothetical protein